MPKPVDILQGTLDMLILNAVSLGPLHGYAILKRLEQISSGAQQVPQGSLYPALADFVYATPGYFEALKFRLLDGRWVAGLLLLAAGIASLVPSMRIAHRDPAQTLREE